MRNTPSPMVGLFIILLSLSIGMSGFSATVQAADEKKDAVDEKTEEELAEEELERQRQEVYDQPVQSNEIDGWPQGPGTYGEAAIVMEVGTGAILYAKNIDAHEYPASITKVLTALVALENGDLSDTVTFSADSVAFLQPGDSSIGLKEGDEITLEQALYAMLLASANEAAYAVGENVGLHAGYDYDWFIQQMNEKCQELGGENSNFVNTNGLHDENHYTCARDMALIGRALFDDPEFFDIVQTLEYTIPASDTVAEHVFQQKDKMLKPDSSKYYEYAIGGKTGFTSDALATLITMADNGDTQLVSVVLRTFSGYTYSDSTALLDYGFDNFTKVNVADYEQSPDVEEVYEEEDGGYVMLPSGVDFSDLTMEITWEDQRNRDAVLTYSYEGNYVGEANAIVSDAYVQTHTVQIEDVAPEEATRATEESLFTVENMVLAGLCILLVLLVVILVILLQRRRKKNLSKNLDG